MFSNQHNMIGSPFENLEKCTFFFSPKGYIKISRFLQIGPRENLFLIGTSAPGMCRARRHNRR